MTEVDICNQALALIGEAPSITSISPPDGSPHAQVCALFYGQARQSVLELRTWSFAARRATMGAVRVAVTFDPALNLVTTATAHGLLANQKFRVVKLNVGGAMPTPVVEDTDYYVATVFNSTGFYMTTELDGDILDLTTSGTGQFVIEKQSDRSSWPFMYALPTDYMRSLAVLPPGVADEDFPYATSGGSWNESGATLQGYPVAYGPQGALVAAYKVEVNTGGDLVVYTTVEDADLRYCAAVTDTTQWSALFTQAVTWQLASLLAGAIKRSEQTANWCMQMFERALGKASSQDANASNLPLPQNHPWDRG